MTQSVFWCLSLIKLKKYKCRPLDGVSEVVPCEEKEKPEPCVLMCPFGLAIPSDDFEALDDLFFTLRQISLQIFI